jgi:hypothetical protein
MMAFTDGRYVGACLDRNGLRPSRYYVTSDDRLLLSSEVSAVLLRAVLLRAVLLSVVLSELHQALCCVLGVRGRVISLAYSTSHSNHIAIT